MNGINITKKKMLPLPRHMFYMLIVWALTSFAKTILPDVDFVNMEIWSVEGFFLFVFPTGVLPQTQPRTIQPIAETSK